MSRVPIAGGAALLLLVLAPAPAPAQRRPACLGHAATLVGTPDSDRLVGTRGRDVIVGLGSRDTLIGGRGDDILCAGSGDDWLLGDTGDDRLAGNRGSDLISGDKGADSLLGGPGADELVGDNDDPHPEDRGRGGPGADVCLIVSSGRTCEKTPTRPTERVAVTTLVASLERPIEDAHGAGDVNGDGRADLLLGSSPAAGGAGVVTLLLGPLDRAREIDVGAAERAVRIRGAHGASEDPSDDYPRGDRAHLVDAGDVNGDGLADVIVGAPGSTAHDQPDAGRMYVIFGRRGVDDVDLAAYDANEQGDSGFQIVGPGGGPDGMEIAFLGDVNRDGLGDLAVGWRFGHTYVVFGKTGGGPVDLRFFDLGLHGDAGYRIETASGGNRFDLAAAGDVDGDGSGDVVVSRSEWDEDPDFPLGVEYAETWISYGKADSSNVDSADLERTGTRIDWSFEDRFSTGAGDVNGDGFDDVALTNIPSYGTVKVLMGGSHLRGATYSSSFRSPFVIDASYMGASFGESAPVKLGDVDGDGLGDFAFASASGVSSPNRQNVYRRRDEIGSVFAVRGSTSGGPDAAYAMGTGGFRLLGPRLTGCRRSCSSYDPRHRVSFLGDVDADGADDVFVYTGFGDRGFIVLSRPRR